MLDDPGAGRTRLPDRDPVYPSWRAVWALEPRLNLPRGFAGLRRSGAGSRQVRANDVPGIVPGSIKDCISS
jgi:hypothetical protein